MTVEEFEAILKRLAASRKLPCGDDSLHIGHDFDSEEIALWSTGDPKKTRFDSKRLWNLLNAAKEPITEHRIVALLCDIYRRPQAHVGVSIR